jgi:hypothetical protein
MAASRVAAYGRAPEEDAVFRVAQLLVLFQVAAESGLPALDIDRTGYFDFFAAHPLLLVDPDSREERVLRTAGFRARTMAYHSSSQRFTNRRARLQHDLAIAVARRLVRPGPAEGRVAYSLTELGNDIAAEMTSFYADAYRQSASIVVGRLRKLSETALRTLAYDRLGASHFMIDIYSDASGDGGAQL